MRRGTTALTNFMRGITQIQKIMRGTTLVWERWTLVTAATMVTMTSNTSPAPYTCDGEGTVDFSGDLNRLLWDNNDSTWMQSNNIAQWPIRGALYFGVAKPRGVKLQRVTIRISTNGGSATLLARRRDNGTWLQIGTGSTSGYADIQTRIIINTSHPDVVFDAVRLEASGFSGASRLVECRITEWYE